MGDQLQIALAGDSIITGAINLEEENDRVYDITRGADVSITNLEAPLHNYDVAPVANKGSLYFRSPPRAADELKEAGFDLLSAANNHIGDYSQGGMSKTMEVLEDRGLPYAGLGENLSQARAPTFLDENAKRVALIAATTTFVPGTEAGDVNSDVSGRPGIAPLRLKTHYVVSEEGFEQIQRVGEELNLNDLTKHRSSYLEESGSTYDFLDVDGGAAGDFLTFEQGDEPRIKRVARDRDVETLIKQIDWAAHQADLVIVSVHSHEGANGTYSHPSIPEFLEKLAHTCIDEGADIFLSHGTHQLRGIEIYDGSPVFYSLGNFIVQQNKISRFPSDSYEAHELPESATPADVYRRSDHSEDGFYDVFYEPIQSRSVVPVCITEDAAIDRIELHPIELGSSFRDVRRGLPRIAEDTVQREILKDIDQKSSEYDTSIGTDGEKGIIYI